MSKYICLFIHQKQPELPHTETVSYFWSFPLAFSASFNVSFNRMRGSKQHTRGRMEEMGGKINKFIPMAWMIYCFPETTGQNLKYPS